MFLLLEKMKATLLGLSIFIALLLTSCSRKLYVDHYSLSCEVEGEAGDLCLFSDGNFLLTTKYCNKYMLSEAHSFGKYRICSDSLVILDSENSKLDPITVTESKSIDTIYKLQILDRKGEEFINETLKIVINKKDTLSWLYLNNIPFNPNNPSISSIQLLLTNLNYISPIYYLRNKENNIIKFELKAEWAALSTFPTYLMLDQFKFTKSGNIISGTTNMLTRSSILTLNYVSRTKKTPRKVVKLYFDGNKSMLDYFDMDNERVTTSN